MATSGTNYTGKWTLSNGVLTLAPKSGSSGQFRYDSYFSGELIDFVSLTDSERESVKSIVFSGNVSFYHHQDIMSSTYVKLKDYSNFIFEDGTWFGDGFPNVESIDVTGLNVSGGTSFGRLFGKTWVSNLTSIQGLGSLAVSDGTDFHDMFESSKLDSVDVSHFPLNTAKDIGGMFNGMYYCATITLPSNFKRTNVGDDSSTVSTDPYSFGLAPATNANGITVRKDEDFFKLPDGQQGGVWTRDISGTAKLRFSVSGTTREADKATITYSYATSTATGSLYIKKSSESSFPSEPAETFTLTGTGNGSIEVTLPTDDSYDVWIVVTDGNETIYTYPSIDSNILLFKIKKSGDTETTGSFTSAITACGNNSTDLSLTTSRQIIPMTTYIANVGSQLSVSNNGVRCGKTGFVEVSANIYFTSEFTNGDLVHLIIRKGTTDIMDFRHRLSGTYTFYGSAPIVYEVSAGDYLYLYAYNQTAARGKVSRSTLSWLTVKYL